METAAHPTNLSENPTKFTKKKTNGISLWAFLLSIFIYISIFYTFNLSPMNLLRSTKFWFFISNTLILIIAADFTVFFSSRKSDFYQETACFSPSFEAYMQRRNSVEKNNTQEKVVREITPPEEIKCVIFHSRNEHEVVAKEMGTDEHEVVVAKEMGTVTKNDSEKRYECESFQGANSNILQVKAQSPVQHEAKKREAKRSNSEVGILLEENEEEKRNNNGLQRKSASFRFHDRDLQRDFSYSIPKKQIASAALHLPQQTKHLPPSIFLLAVHTIATAFAPHRSLRCHRSQAPSPLTFGLQSPSRR
nr:DNA ligase 1 [Ipomoea batatas]